MSIVSDVIGRKDALSQLAVLVDAAGGKITVSRDKLEDRTEPSRLLIGEDPKTGDMVFTTDPDIQSFDASFEASFEDLK